MKNASVGTESKYNGYVVYYNGNNNIPLGIVSDTYECISDSDYIPKRIKEFAVTIEDKRFYTHKGVDLKGIIRALVCNVKHGRIVQGGSTLTQQLARNIMRNDSKTFNRKIRETISALSIERHYTKDEILKLYFNNVYFGKNVRGIRAAGLYYFGKEPQQLSQAEQLYLLTILRGPNYYINHLDKAINRYTLLNNILAKLGIISYNCMNRNSNTQLRFEYNSLNAVRNTVVPYIVNSLDNKHRTLYSTIDIELQKFIQVFVQQSKYPVSIIAIKSKQVMAVYSSYGMDYPFMSKANVGSTLKPFMYCYLRNNGISKEERFDASANTLGWIVREVDSYESVLTLPDALYYSNNNTFVNAVSKVGIDNSLIFLSKILDCSINNLYPSSILGATRNGLSLYDLAIAYNKYFQTSYLSQIQKECLSILNVAFQSKTGLLIEDIFLKTGTTNNNNERYAILGHEDRIYAFLRNENPIDDKSKDGSFMQYIRAFGLKLIEHKTDYRWS
jgi:penicillin-binding protein 1A